ncbi:MAG TPA: efflux RND transporter periplasmic adaptor subunit [Polyangia bacterium]
MLTALVALVVGIGGTIAVLRAAGCGPTRARATGGGPATAAADGGMPGMPGMPGMSASAPAVSTSAPASQRVQISPERQQLIGVRTAVVAPHDVGASLRTVGVLAYDQTRVTEIHTRITGWVDRLYVNYTGKAVRKGQPLFSVYSPELVSTQVDYLLGLRQRREGGGAALADATRQRLKLWEISDAQIARLERTQQPERTLTLYSPFDGVVLERTTFAGQYITPDMKAFRIGDLSTIWVIAEVFEYELPRIKIGQRAEVVFPNGESGPVAGTVAFIYPDIDPQTRRVKLRLELKNPGRAFKPDSYVTVVLRSDLGARLVVPKEAIIDTGPRQYALIALPGGYFEPRTVKIGPAGDEYYAVLDGLQAGDRVVTSAQFLIDSETNLQAAMQSMSMSMPGMEMGKDKGKGQGGDMKGMPMPPAPSGTKRPPMAPSAPPPPGGEMKGMPMPAHQH